ncbi:MAG: hypothetical protein ACHQVS_05510, partial [Candidatus Babeliales bacterium]
INAYDYVEDMHEHIPVRYKSKKQVYTILDNHRRKLAKKDTPEVRAVVSAVLSGDTAGIVMQYVGPVYPLIDVRPLTSFELVNDGIK